MNIYQTLYFDENKYAFFSGTHRIVTKIEHLLGHKENISTFLEVEITTVSDHNAIKLEFKTKKFKRPFHLNFSNFLITHLLLYKKYPKTWQFKTTNFYYLPAHMFPSSIFREALEDTASQNQ